MNITVENQLGEPVEVKLRPVTHGDRKKWLSESKKVKIKTKKLEDETDQEFKDRIDELEDEAATEFQEFREKFLKDHILSPNDMNLENLPSVSVDSLLKALEKEMDFSIGLSSKFSNTPPKKEP